MRDAIEMFDQRPQTVAVCRHQDAAHRPNVGDDLVVPIRQQTVDHIGQGFGRGDGVGGHLGVAGVMRRVSRILALESGRGEVVRPSPRLDLGHPMLLSHALLVLTLKCPVVPFVEAPMLVDRDPPKLHGSERERAGVDGTTQHRGVQHVEFNASRSHGRPGFGCLHDPSFGELDVGPTGENVLQVPHALTVAQQHEGVLDGVTHLCPKPVRPILCAGATTA